MSDPTFLRAFRWNYEKAMLQIRDDVKSFHSLEYLEIWRTTNEPMLILRKADLPCTIWCETATEAVALAADSIDQKAAQLARER